jgi:hypothetical protein
MRFVFLIKWSYVEAIVQPRCIAQARVNPMNSLSVTFQKHGGNHPRREPFRHVTLGVNVVAVVEASSW